MRPPGGFLRFAIKLRFTINDRVLTFSFINHLQFLPRDSFSQQNRVLARCLSSLILSIITPASRSSVDLPCSLSRGHLNLFTYRGKTMRSLVLCSPFSPYELANQFNRAVGRSKKIIGAGWLFKIRGPRIVSGSQSCWNSVCTFASIFHRCQFNSPYDNIDSSVEHKSYDIFIKIKYFLYLMRKYSPSAK